MRAPEENDVIRDLVRAVAALDLNLTAIHGMAASAGHLDLDAGTRELLGHIAKALGESAAGASRAAATLIENSAEDVCADLALEWNLEHHLDVGFTGCRGCSVKHRNDVDVGTPFHVDEVWRGEIGTLVGVVWHDGVDTFEWLSPLELKLYTRPIADRGDGAKAGGDHATT